MTGVVLSEARGVINSAALWQRRFPLTLMETENRGPPSKRTTKTELGFSADSAADPHTSWLGVHACGSIAKRYPVPPSVDRVTDWGDRLAAGCEQK